MATLDIIESYLSNRSTEWRTEISTFEDGSEQRRSKWSAARREFNLRLNPWSDQKTQEIWDFFNARKGAYEGFNFYQNIFWQYVNTGDDATKIYTVHEAAYVALSTVMYLDGVATTAFAETTPASGIVTFTDNVPNGVVIRADYKHSIAMRFVNDTLSFEEFSLALYRGDLALIEDL